jgi:hypothetical protein
MTSEASLSTNWQRLLGRGPVAFALVLGLTGVGNAGQPPQSIPPANPSPQVGPRPANPPAPQPFPLPGLPGNGPGGPPGGPGGFPVFPAGAGFGGGNFGSGFGGGSFNSGFVGGPHFHFQIDPNTPARDLLPAVPRFAFPRGPLLTDNLASVPEVQFDAPIPADHVPAKTLERIAHQMAKINFLNSRKPDGAMEALLANRPDLSGLPVAMGDKCRTPAEQNRHFKAAVEHVRAALQNPNNPAQSPQQFWDRFKVICDRFDRKAPVDVEAHVELRMAARVAALMQMLAPEPAPLRVGLAKYLAMVPRVEATRALAQLAVFAPEETVRQAALEGLVLRRERDYTDVLVRGLRYPLPAVARNAAAAIARLQRTDLAPQLLALLLEPDARAPVVKTVGGREVPMVREVVRINHVRNCVLCHAPADSGKAPLTDVLQAQVPVPGQQQTPSFGGYQNSFVTPDILVRVDVNYLRQDFSVMQPAADVRQTPGQAKPKTSTTRFDFVVRTRPLSAKDAAAWRLALAKAAGGPLTPYQRAALAALQQLAGQATQHTLRAWQRWLNLSRSV